MKAEYCEQGSSEWLQLRCGLITASRMAEVMEFLKRGGESAGRANYRAELIAERLTGMTAEHYVSREMEFGTENEPLARTAYEIEREVMADRVGFIYHPTIEMSGASPDSLIGKEGGLEIKVPKTATHLKWIQAGIVPQEHRDQMQWNMDCAERDWWDFMSFDPRLPKRYQKFIVRLDRDEGRIAELRDGVRLMDRETAAAITALEARFPALPEPLRTYVDDMDGAGLTDADFIGLV